jgi:putative protease
LAIPSLQAPGARVPELLSPAADLDCLRTAFRFGADAVYLGLKAFSMRNRAKNFSQEDFVQGLAHARGLGKRVYVALNSQIKDEDLPALDQTLDFLADARPDALIVADPGVLATCARRLPGLPLHISTQANTMNSRAAALWHSLGATRIIAPRELSLAELETLVRASPLEIEAFIHGAMCIAYSGRCFLSLYWANRDPRKGDCAQACRWPYRLLEDSRRPGQGNPVETDGSQTWFFDSKDLCALPLLDRLLATGVTCLKIEGRTRSPLYVATVTGVYRRALDLLAQGNCQDLEAALPALVAELNSTNHRGFSTHFLEGSVPDHTYTPEGSALASRNSFVGILEEVSQGQGLVRLKNPLTPGQELELLRPQGPGPRFQVEGLRGEIWPKARALSEERVWLNLPPEAEAGDLLRS